MEAVPSVRPRPPAVCLLSGGIDSSVTLALARGLGFDVHALTVSYGQRHRVEIDAASRIARALGVGSHRTISLDVRVLGGVRHTGPLPVHAMHASAGPREPTSRVPVIGAMMMTLALGWADALGARHLFLGPNLLGASRNDTEATPFQASLEAVANLSGPSHEEAFHIRAPLMGLKKSEVISRADEVGIDLSITHTCSNPVPLGCAIVACGACASCVWRLHGFREIGRPDPVSYARLPA